MYLKSIKDKIDTIFTKKYKTQLYIVLMSLVVSLMSVYWIGYSIYNSKYMDALNLSQILIILAATMSVLSFTYTPIVDEEDKNRIKRSGELFFVATIFMIIGTVIILIFYIPIMVNLPKIGPTPPIFYLFSGSLPFVIYLGGILYLFEGVVSLYQYFKKKGIIKTDIELMPL